MNYLAMRYPWIREILESKVVLPADMKFEDLDKETDMVRKITKKEAERLHDEAGAMTMKELRKLNNSLGFGNWNSNVDKPFMVREFRKSLEKRMKTLGPAVQLPRESTYTPAAPLPPPRKLTAREQLTGFETSKLVEGLIAAVKDMGNPHWDDHEIEEIALGYVKNAARICE